MTIQQYSPSLSIPPPAGEDGMLTEKGAALAQLLQRQKLMFDLQVQELVRLVAVQQDLTGNNPLKEELVSLILGEKAGSERKGEPLSAAAVKGLLSVFALKDTLTKAEVRLISAANSVTPAQVKEFFTSQRRCVRRLLLQRPKLEGSAEQSLLHMEGDGSSGPKIKTCNDMDPRLSEIVDRSSGGLAGENAAQVMVQLMQAEEGMTGRGALANVLLRTKQRQQMTRLVELNCLEIVGGWLLQAMKEEQTSLLRALLKVLERLPAQKCPTSQLSVVTKSVSRLSSYFVQDIGAMAKFLSSRWKKIVLQESAGGEEKTLLGKKNGAVSAVGGKGTTILAGVGRKQAMSEMVLAARRAIGASEATGLKKPLAAAVDALSNLKKAGALSQKRAQDLVGGIIKSTTATQQAEPPNKKLKTGGGSATGGAARSVTGFEKLSMSNGLLEQSRQGRAAFELLQKSGMAATVGHVDGSKKRTSLADQTKVKRKVQVVEKEDAGVVGPVVAADRGEEKSGKSFQGTQFLGHRPELGDDLKKANARKRLMNGDNDGQIPSLAKKVEGLKGKEKDGKESGGGTRVKGTASSGPTVLPGVSHFHGYTSALGPNLSKVDRSKRARGDRARIGISGSREEDGRKRTPSKGVSGEDSPERPTTPLRIFDWDDEPWKKGTIERPGTPLRLRPDENTWCMLPAKPAADAGKVTKLLADAGLTVKSLVDGGLATEPTEDGLTAVQVPAEGCVIAKRAVDGSPVAGLEAAHPTTAVLDQNQMEDGRMKDQQKAMDAAPIKVPVPGERGSSGGSPVTNVKLAECSEVKAMLSTGEGLPAVDTAGRPGVDGSSPAPGCNTEIIAAKPSQALPCGNTISTVAEVLVQSGQPPALASSNVLSFPTDPVAAIPSLPVLPAGPTVPSSAAVSKLQVQDEPLEKAVMGIEAATDTECKVDDVDETSLEERPPPLRLTVEEMAAAIEAMENEKIPWRTPEVFLLSELWFVAYGEESKEVAVQDERLRREEEFFGGTNMIDMPDVAQEPWDQEPDYDESLTPIIPSELELSANEAGTDSAVLQDDAQSVPAEFPESASGLCKVEPEAVATELVNKLKGPSAEGQSGTISTETAKFLPQEPLIVAKSEATANKGPALSGMVPAGRKMEGVGASYGSGLEAILGLHGINNQDASLLAMFLQNPDLVAQLTSMRSMGGGGGNEGSLAMLEALVANAGSRKDGAVAGQLSASASTALVQQAAPAPSVPKHATSTGDLAAGVTAILSDAIRTAVRTSHERRPTESANGALGSGKDSRMQSVSDAKRWQQTTSAPQGIGSAVAAPRDRSAHWPSSTSAQSGSQPQPTSSISSQISLPASNPSVLPSTGPIGGGLASTGGEVPSNGIGPATLEQTLMEQIQQILPGVLSSVPLSSKSGHALRQQSSLGGTARDPEAIALALGKELAALTSGMSQPGMQQGLTGGAHAAPDISQSTATLRSPSSLPPLLQQPASNSSADDASAIQGPIGRRPPPPPPPRTSIAPPVVQPAQVRTSPPMPSAAATSKFQALPLPQTQQGGLEVPAPAAAISNVSNIQGGPPGFNAPPSISPAFSVQGPRQTAEVKRVPSPESSKAMAVMHGPCQAVQNTAPSGLPGPVLPMVGLQGQSPPLGPLLPTPAPPPTLFTQPRVLVHRSQIPVQDPAVRQPGPSMPEQLRQPHLVQDQKPALQVVQGTGQPTGPLLVVQHKLAVAPEQHVSPVPVHGSPMVHAGEMLPQQSMPTLPGKELPPPVQNRPQPLATPVHGDHHPPPPKQSPFEGLDVQRHVPGHGQPQILASIGQPSEAPHVSDQQRASFSLSLQSLAPPPLHPPSQSQQKLPPNPPEHQVQQLPMSDHHWPAAAQNVWRPAMPLPGINALPGQRIQLREDQQHASPARDQCGPVLSHSQQSMPTVMQAQVQQLAQDRRLLHPPADLQHGLPTPDQPMHSPMHGLGAPVPQGPRPPAAQGMILRKASDTQHPSGINILMERGEKGMAPGMQQAAPSISHTPQAGLPAAPSVGPPLPPGPPPPVAQGMMGGNTPEQPAGIGMSVARGEKMITHARPPPPASHMSHSQQGVIPAPQWSGPPMQLHVPHSMRPEVQGMASTPLGSPPSTDLSPAVGRADTVHRGLQPFHTHLYPHGPNSQPVLTSPMGPGPGPGSAAGVQEDGGLQNWAAAPRMAPLSQARWDVNHPGGGNFCQLDTSGLHAPNSGQGEGWGGRGERVAPSGRGPGDGGEAFLGEFQPHMLPPGAAHGHGHGPGPVQFMGNSVYGGFSRESGRPWGPDTLPQHQDSSFPVGGEAFRPPPMQRPPFSPQAPHNPGLW